MRETPLGMVKSWKRLLLGAVVLAGLGIHGCGSASDVIPQTGYWHYEDGGILVNYCGNPNVWKDPDTTFWLTGYDEGYFTVDQGENGSFDCMISGSSFQCPTRLAGESPVEGYDAAIQYHVSITGTLESETEMSGTQMVDVACLGADCSLAPLGGWTLPCSYQIAFTATKL